MLTQIPGGYVTSRKGGRRVLPFGVGLWSAATAAVPLLAGTMPGAVGGRAMHVVFICSVSVNTILAWQWLSCVGRLMCKGADKIM
jgi:hypothetical protein